MSWNLKKNFMQRQVLDFSAYQHSTESIKTQIPQFNCFQFLKLVDWFLDDEMQPVAVGKIVPGQRSNIHIQKPLAFLPIKFSKKEWEKTYWYRSILYRIKSVEGHFDSRNPESRCFERNRVWKARRVRPKFNTWLARSSKFPLQGFQCTIVWHSKNFLWLEIFRLMPRWTAANIFEQKVWFSGKNKNSCIYSPFLSLMYPLCKTLPKKWLKDALVLQKCWLGPGCGNSDGCSRKNRFWIWRHFIRKCTFCKKSASHDSDARDQAQQVSFPYVYTNVQKIQLFPCWIKCRHSLKEIGLFFKKNYTTLAFWQYRSINSARWGYFPGILSLNDVFR